MFRKVHTISMASNDIDAVKKTYMDVLGMAPPARTTVYEKGRYREHSFLIGDIVFELLQPLEGTDGPGGGGMKRFLQRHGEGLYLITVAVDDPEKYAKGLEAKGVKVFWDVPDHGVTTAGTDKPYTTASEHPTHPLIHPRYTHGVLWELSRHNPKARRDPAPQNQPFKKVRTISIACNDIDAALKTYTEVLGVEYIRSTRFPEGKYREHTLRMGDVVLELLQPLEGTEGPGGGAMKRFLQSRGEGLYLITVDVDDPEGYAKSLEAKGVRIAWDVVSQIQQVGGAPRAHQAPSGKRQVHPLIHPRNTHGILWELSTAGTPSLSETA